MSDIHRTIVVGYDGSPDADLALTWAAHTASLEGLFVRTVLVDEVDNSPWNTHGWEPDDSHGTRVEAVLEGAGVQGSAERVSGHVVEVLVDAARDAAMVVVGSRGRGRVAEAMLGSVSQHLVRQATCPAVVVRRTDQASPSRIVVGIDGSGGSEAALEFACRRAELTGEPVVAVHGWRLGSTLVGRDGGLPASIGPEILDKELLLAESIAGLRETHPGVALSAEAIPVGTWQALVDASVTASLVVTGSRGRGAFPGMLLGSVSHAVVHGAHCPVAVVR